MRPRKVVFLYGGTEVLRSVQRFILDNSRYRVYAAQTLQECSDMNLHAPADAEIECLSVDAAVMLEWVKVACARKRGPQPTYRRVALVRHESEVI